MPYKYSKIDEYNSNWFKNDNSKGTLLGIKLLSGHLRSLYEFELKFEYPISVIAGKNGSGKTTILALAACAFHNLDNGFKLPKRKNSYYTFSDFLIQSKEEMSPAGINISYNILHNNWKNPGKSESRVGPGIQKRIKKIGGKWNDYSSRVKRNVVFFGIDRVVPHSEKSVYRSYRNRFKTSKREVWEKDVKDIIGRILNKNYDDFWHKEHSDYRLPMVQSGENIYSGFNMGAGENALFEIFSTIFACPLGVLLVIDEIELGLHDEAQTRFINELKKVCNLRKVQIICTTHSYNIMASVPPEARFFVENFKEKTIITSKISPSFASGKLSGENSNELYVYVEDTIGKALLESALDNNLRRRINILPIGSSIAVIRQLASHYINLKNGECVAILDGDQSSKITNLAQNFISQLETVEDQVEAENWMKERLRFLPGTDWPEKWIMKELKKNNITELAKDLRLDKKELSEHIDEAIRAGKHNEFFSLSIKTNLERDSIITFVSRHVVEMEKTHFDELQDFISTFLE